MPELLRRGLLPLACLSALSLALPAAAEAPAGKPKEQLSEIQQKIESLKKALEDTSDAKADAADALKDSEKAISDSSRKLFDLNQQQKQGQEKLRTLQQQKAGLEGTITTQQTMLGQQYYQQYIHGQPGFVQLALQQQDPNQLARQLTYYAYIAKNRAGLIADMQGNLQKLAEINEAANATLQQVTELKESQEKTHQSLQQQKSERQKLLTSLSAKINAQRNEIDKLKRDEKRLSSLVDKLAKQAAAAEAARRKAAKATPKPSPDKPASNKPQQAIGRNDSLPTDAFDGSSFTALKGKLSLPVRGDILNRFGASREDTGVSWKGLFIRAGEGSDVKSVAAGKVVFADWLRGFGNLLIVDHGGGYMSLYGNNEALLKQVGDTVKGGDTLASVGNSGGNPAAGLYFELRYQGKPFDPLSWSAGK